MKIKRHKLWSALRAHRTRYTHVLTAYATENNLRRMAQRKAKAEAQRG